MIRQLFAATVVVIASAGCGGGGGGSHSTTPPGGGVSGNTNTPVLDSTSPNAVNSPGGAATPVTLTVNGAPEADAVPGGENIPAGADVLLLPATLPVYLNYTAGAIVHGIRPDQAALMPGSVYLKVGASFVDTGLYVSAGQIVGTGGKVYKHYVFAYPPAGSTRNITMLIAGPVQLGSSSNFLDIGTSVEFDFQISVDGKLGAGKQSTYPTGALYVLPTNGQSLYESFLRLNIGRLSTNFAVPTSVRISWPGTIKGQTRTTEGGESLIWSAGNGVTDVIPTSGVDTVVVGVQAP